MANPPKHQYYELTKWLPGKSSETSILRTNQSVTWRILRNISITEAGETDYPWFWSSTTHESWAAEHAGTSAAYVCFGSAMGYMDRWMDVHGAGAQRSDPKTGNPDDYPCGRGTQGDAIRIYNFVRLVRDL